MLPLVTSHKVRYNCRKYANTIQRERMKRYTLILSCLLVAMYLPERCSADSKMYAAVSEEDRLGSRSDEYSRVFDNAISALVDKKPMIFRRLLTTATVTSENRGPAAIDHIIRDRFIPFFDNFSELTEHIATAPTFDTQGHTGLAFARSFRTKSGERKTFVIYLVEENKVIKVGNLLLNATEAVFDREKKGLKNNKAR